MCGPIKQLASAPTQDALLQSVRTIEEILQIEEINKGALVPFVSTGSV